LGGEVRARISIGSLILVYLSRIKNTYVNSRFICTREMFDSRSVIGRFYSDEFLVDIRTSQILLDNLTRNIL